MERGKSSNLAGLLAVAAGAAIVGYFVYQRSQKAVEKSDTKPAAKAPTASAAPADSAAPAANGASAAKPIATLPAAKAQPSAAPGKVERSRPTFSWEKVRGLG